MPFLKQLVLLLAPLHDKLLVKLWASLSQRRQLKLLVVHLHNSCLTASLVVCVKVEQKLHKKSRRCLMSASKMVNLARNSLSKISCVLLSLLLLVLFSVLRSVCLSVMVLRSKGMHLRLTEQVIFDRKILLIFWLGSPGRRQNNRCLI